MFRGGRRALEIPLPAAIELPEVPLRNFDPRRIWFYWGITGTVPSVQWAVRKPNKLALSFRVDLRFGNSFYPKDILSIGR